MTDLQTADELTAAMECGSQQQALRRLIRWLERRDDILDQIKIDDIALALETIAAELGRESTQQSPNSRGLALGGQDPLRRRPGRSAWRPLGRRHSSVEPLDHAQMTC